MKFFNFKWLRRTPRITTLDCRFNAFERSLLDCNVRCEPAAAEALMVEAAHAMAAYRAEIEALKSFNTLEVLS